MTITYPSAIFVVTDITFLLGKIPASLSEMIPGARQGHKDLPPGFVADRTGAVPFSGQVLDELGFFPAKSPVFFSTTG